MPGPYIDRIRREAFAILADHTARVSLRRLAWITLKTHGVK